MDAVDLGVNLFVALFALVDPIGNLPIFAAATAGASLKQRVAVSWWVCLFAAVFMVLIFFTGLAMRARRRATVRARRSDDVIEAQKVGDTWVAYGWERHQR